MKKAMFLLLLFLLPTACAPSEASSSPAQSAPALSSDPSVGSASTPAVRAPLPAGFVSAPISGACDFDRDGTEECYTLSISSPESGMERFSLTIEDQTVTHDACSLHETPWLVSLDGETVQIAIHDYGPSNDPLTFFYGWNGAAITEAGQLAAEPDNISLFPEGYEAVKPAIVAPERRDILQYSCFPMLYGMEDNRLVRVLDPDRWYEYCGGIGELTMRAETALYSSNEPHSDGRILVPAGAAVTVTGVALDRPQENEIAPEWPLYPVRIEVDATGETGYLFANAIHCLLPTGATDSYEVFEGLLFAD